jgi:hypothetical protein
MWNSVSRVFAHCPRGLGLTDIRNVTLLQNFFSAKVKFPLDNHAQHVPVHVHVTTMTKPIFRQVTEVNKQKSIN